MVINMKQYIIRRADDGFPANYELLVPLDNGWLVHTAKALKVDGSYVLMDSPFTGFNEFSIFGVETDPKKADRRLYERLNTESVRLASVNGGEIVDKTGYTSLDLLIAFDDFIKGKCKKYVYNR